MDSIEKNLTFSNAFRLSIVKDMVLLDFAYAETNDDVLTDDNVQKVATIGMQIGLLEVLKTRIDETLEELNQNENQ